jgi:hypothetical protein
VTTISLDVELTDWRGDIVSIGMISECGRELYIEVEHSGPSRWTVDNVYPKLGGRALRVPDARRAVGRYLKLFDACRIVVDWPDDIRALCGLLTFGEGRKEPTPPLSFEIADICVPVSGASHHALVDAKDLMALLK